MTDVTTEQLLKEAEQYADIDPAVLRLVRVIRRQQAQIAALEAARAPHEEEQP